MSADAKAIKIWDRDGGKTYTTIQPPADVNDVAIFPGTGMVFAALETERLGAYFLPSLGPAPRWCHFLDAMTEEMEEAPASQSLYDDYKFVTREELDKLGMASMIGTNLLRAYMHGFFVDARLHSKAVAAHTPFDYEAHRKEAVQKKIEKQRPDRILIKKRRPKVNAEMASRLLSEKPKKGAADGKALLEDERRTT